MFTCKVTNAVGACPCLPLLDCIGCVPPASLAMRASVRQRYSIPVRPGIHSLPPTLRGYDDLCETLLFTFILHQPKVSFWGPFLKQTEQLQSDHDAFYILSMASCSGCPPTASLLCHLSPTTLDPNRSQAPLVQTDPQWSSLGKVYPCVTGTVKRRRDEPGGGSGWIWSAAIRKEVADNVGSRGGGVGRTGRRYHGAPSSKMPEVLLKTSPSM